MEIESVGTCEYDPDDMDLEGPAAIIATAAAGQIPGMIPRIKLAATSDLKEFHGRDQDEDRARSWLSTVKTAFARTKHLTTKSVWFSVDCCLDQHRIGTGNWAARFDPVGRTSHKNSRCNSAGW